MSEITVTKDNFDQVIHENKTVLLDFYADWCGPCKMLAPFVEQIAAEHPEIVVGKIDIDVEIELAVGHKVASIPTLMVYKDGEIHKKSLGFIPKEEIEALLN